MPAVLGVNVYVFVPGLVSGPTPVPSGESILSCVIASPEVEVNVAVIVDDCPTWIVLPSDEVIDAVGAAGGVTVRVYACQPLEPPEPCA